MCTYAKKIVTVTTYASYRRSHVNPIMGRKKYWNSLVA